jgi:long-chain acyl-CoA synthetase
LILKTLAELLPPNREIQLGDHLDLDLGFDSLKRVEFQVALERQLGNLPEMFMGEIVTVRDVIEKVRGLEHIHPGEAEAPQSWHELFEAPLSPALRQRFLTAPSSVNRVVGAAALALFEGLFRIAFRLTVTGTDQLPKHGPYLIASNHLSFIDPFILLSALPRSVFAQLYILGWEPYFRSLFRLWVARVGHVIPVGPETPVLSVLRASAALLRSGKSLLIFPEGQRSIDGQLLPFKKGIGVLACELSVPIIPVKIEGSYQAWPPDAQMPHFHPIKVKIGKSLTIIPSTIQTWAANGVDPHVAAAKMIHERVASL